MGGWEVVGSKEVRGEIENEDGINGMILNDLESIYVGWKIVLEV